MLDLQCAFLREPELHGYLAVVTRHGSAYALPEHVRQNPDLAAAALA